MAGLKKWSLVLCLIVTAAGAASCRKVEYVFIHNNTPDRVSIEAILITESGSQTLATEIGPGESDGWRFEVAGEAEEIDKKLRSISASNKQGCRVELNRKQIVDIAAKDGAWKIVIDEEVMNCEQ